MRSAPVLQLSIALLFSAVTVAACTVQSSQAPAPAPTPTEPSPTPSDPPPSTNPPTTPPTNPPTMEAPNPGDKLVAQHTEWATKMCACKDKACATDVNKGFEAWILANQKVQGTPEQKSTAAQIQTRYTKCMMDAMVATPPDSAALPGMGQKCGTGDACAASLECVKYYGIAGKRGGEFTSCEKRCGKGKAACADSERCATIADGPGQVCRPK